MYIKFSLLILILSGFLLAACEEPEPVVITATPVDAPQVVYITATPDFTATPPPVATPELPPEDAITAAESALFNGNFLRAVELYQSILSQDFVDGTLRSSAFYGLGKAALRETLYEQAIFAFNSMVQEFPDDSRIPQVYYMRGEAHAGLGTWDQAISDFQRYLELRPGVIDSYVYEKIGDAYLAQGQNNLAFENYTLAANSVRSSTPLAALREEIAQAYLNQGQYTLAIEQYDSILTFAQNNGYRASITYQAAQAEIAAGQQTEGYARLLSILDTYPETGAAYQAMQTLLTSGFSVDSLLQAQISFNNEDYGSTIAALSLYLAENGSLPLEYQFMLGRAYRENGNFNEAITTFQSIIDGNSGNPDIYGDAWLSLGRTYFRSANYTGAINHYSQLSTDQPANPYAAEGLWRAGFIYLNYLNDTERALATFDILGKAYPGNTWAQDGLLLAAETALNTGQTGRAQAFYTQLANTGTGENKALAFLWLGRLYQQQNQTELAQQAFLGATQADTTGYYTLRAQDLLSGQEPFSPPTSYQFSFNDGQDIANAEQWMRDTFGIQQQGALYPRGDTLLNDSHMIRGNELWELGNYDDARIEFETLREQYKDDPLSTYQLAHYFARIGNYRTSIEAAASLIISANVSTFDAPVYIARLRYPIHYSDLVLPFSEQYGLDPLLVFSLIRQESLFQSFATSFAFAQGLMQIIPDTGNWIATQLEWENYENSDVYRPYINVQFGTYYLKWVLDYVNGVKFAALAGYNGGPGNALTWLNASGNDLDRFVQTVTFSETRSYVTLIYEQYHVYRHLYGN